jgi:hypothetical protein
MNIIIFQAIIFIFVWLLLTTFVKDGFRKTSATTWKERLPWSFLATLVLFIASYLYIL